MKWRKLLDLSTSSSPPRTASRSRKTAGRRSLFEALENRKLFAVDMAETGDFQVTSYDNLPTDGVPAEQVELRTFKFDESAKGEIVDGEVFDEKAFFEPSEIMMMAFRGSEVSDELSETDVVASDGEIDPSIMTMTGVVGDFDDVEVRTLGQEVDLAVTSELVDEVASDDELIYYTMGPGPEVETTSLEESLAPEDVNGDGNVTALDMLLVINALNSYGSLPSSQETAVAELGSSTGNWDINRDGFVTPLDALWLTNYFNSGEFTPVDEGSPAGFAAEARIRYPAEDEAIDQAAPLIEDLGDDIWERA